jgi:micrococcal nuclease
MTDTTPELRPRTTTDGRFCPTCGRRRTGYFRFCNECGFDFDELAPRPDETIAEAVLAQPAPEPAPSPIALSTVNLERPTVPPPAPRWRINERSVVRVAIVGLGLLVVLANMSNLLRPASQPAATAAPSVALVSPVVVESAVPSATPSIAEPSFAPTGPTRLAVVERVIDGDTIEVDIDGESYLLRYIGMDTPEVDDADPAVKQFAEAARSVNVALVEGEEVLLESDISDTDQFGRLLRDVWIIDADGEMVLVNLELVRQGYAQVATFPPDVKYVEMLTDAQESARAEGLGLWSAGASASPSGSGPSASSPPASASPSASPASSSPPAP